MVLLALETSCDETAAAVFDRDAPRLRAEVIASQVRLHELYGGVVPELASREHLAALPVVVSEVLAKAGITIDEVSAVAFTRGPGLKGCLLMGAAYAKGLAIGRGIPIIGVNHIEGHLLAPMLDHPDLAPPYIALVVSGGHTEVVVVHAIGRYEIRSRTRDDAAGEAFDKSANLLGLSYPGGPRLAALADSVVSSRFSLPRGNTELNDFSFSGLKTAISLLVQKARKCTELDEAIRAELAFAVQDAIVSALVRGVVREVKQSGIRRVVVTGGVAANQELRRRLQAIAGITCVAPSLAHCGDNAAMIGLVAWHRIMAGEVTPLAAGVLSRWPVETITRGEVA